MTPLASLLAFAAVYLLGCATGRWSKVVGESDRYELGYKTGLAERQRLTETAGFDHYAAGYDIGWKNARESCAIKLHVEGEDDHGGGS